MFNPSLFFIALDIFLILPIVVLFIILFGKMVVPYGKMTSSSWGSLMIPAKFGWLIMEAPASVFFLVALIVSDNVNAGTIVLFLVWQVHYFHRAFIYPFTAKFKNPMPVAMMLVSMFFQLANTYFQVGWIFFVAPKEIYGFGYLTSWQFILGIVLFTLGTFINRESDNILKNLRKDGETGYKIPYGFLYKYVSCPNYLGEMIIWLGWAVMTKSLVGLAFFLWTIANLLPRALTSHKWYLKTFPDYPEDRKALIPFIL